MIFRKKGAKGGAGEIKLAQLETRLSENKEKVSRKKEVKTGYRVVGGFAVTAPAHNCEHIISSRHGSYERIYGSKALVPYFFYVLHNLHACSEDSG